MLLTETLIDATLMRGELKLDVPLTLPDCLRVRIAISPAAVAAESEAQQRGKSVAAWQRIQERAQCRPIVSGQTLTRDEIV